ncbi:MAG: plasmid stabilization protein [Chloroflexi bacterium]|nr:plasmid stabilization protein [Chloroflexota bacterium]
MASITVRNLDEGLKRRLRVRAAVNGRSMEQEVREILGEALGEEPSEPPQDLGTAIRKQFAAFHAEFGDVDLELPAREPMREPPSFD